MGYIVIAPVGDNLNALFIGMKEFATEQLYLITPSSRLKEAKAVEKKLTVFSIPVHILELKESLMEGTFYQFGQICAKHNPDDIIVNVATGDRLSTCAALSASFANGLKAFGITDGKAMILPIMKLSYYAELSDSKLKILSHLKRAEYTSFSELAEKSSFSVSLLSYHLNGTVQYKGLIELRLVEMRESNRNMMARLSELGSLLLRGYISGRKEHPREKKKK